jgi:SAM-dependent methyltransferase
MTVQPDPTGDPARRFYERSFAAQLNRDGGAYSISRAALEAGNQRYSAAFEYLRDNPGKHVLEMGYGGNGVVDNFAPLCARYEIVDILDRFATEGRPENLAVHIANLDNRFPFEDARFDVVIAMMVIEHLYDPFHAFAEVARVAKPGARIFVNLPNIGSIRCRLDLMLGRLPNTSTASWFDQREWDGGHLHYFTVDSVRRLAEVSGLKLVGQRAVGSMPALKRLRPSLLCHEITYVLEK